MPPKFSLQSILDYRHNRVELLEVELGHLLHAERSAQTFLEALQDSRARLLDQLGQQQQGEIDLFMIARLRSSLTTVDERILQQKARIQELAEQIRTKKEELITARQEEEALEILKEKELDRYLAEQAQRDNRLQDDIYIAQAYRRSVSPA